ncbi:hypothetical protein DWU98_19345 [Dyella monticola]|uniref:Uncharacterized protein n=2 Tax=Dyella monticola TaxID=1927958 RepID=A0A370WSW0_9GAMM|nr:hypothetical protein DWU98_19345 [Dyella monticola]
MGGAVLPAPAALVARPAQAPASAAMVELLSGDIDFCSEIGVMKMACDLLLEYSAPTDPATGVRRMRNPLMLIQSTRLRNGLLDLWVRHQATIWNAERMQEFQSKVVQAIGSALRDSRDDGERVVIGRILGALRGALGDHQVDTALLDTRSTA